MTAVEIIEATPAPHRMIVRIRGLIREGPHKGRMCEGELTLQQGRDLMMLGTRDPNLEGPMRRDRDAPPAGQQSDTLLLRQSFEASSDGTAPAREGMRGRATSGAAVCASRLASPGRGPHGFS
jgi:hypothetical protein